MPYKVFKRGGKYKVYKVDDNDRPVGDALGTHDSQGEAQQQVRAIYANENKEMMMGMPCTFAEMEEMEAAGEMHEEMMDLTGKFKALCDNVMMNPDIEDKGAAVEKLAGEYRERVGKMKPGMMKQAINAITGLFKPKEAPGLYIWKEGDTYRWIAAYSNNRRDEDDPAEIISSESHKEFDRALGAGEWPMPELWLWHVEFPVGVTQFHAYDEKTGFPIAAGVFYKEMDWAAEGIIKAGWDGVSHGMPTVEIRRDNDDPTIITRHRTREVSILPVWAAANKLAFNIITKENDMSEDKQMPAHKLEEFVKAFGQERAEQIQAALENKAKEADEAGIEKKEAEPIADVQAETPEPEQPLTRDEVVEAIGLALAPVSELVEAVKQLKAELDALKADKEQQAREKEEVTPAHSLLAKMLQAQSIIGQPEARIDGRETLAKDGPEEAKPEPLHSIPLISNIKAANQRYAGR